MATGSLKQMLSSIDLFAGLSPALIDQIAQSGTTFKSGPGSKLITEGANESGLRVILDGSATVDVGGVQRPAIGPGDYVGELSMIDGSPRSATVAAGPQGCTSFALSSMAFMPLVRENPEIAVGMLKTLVARVRSAEAAAPEED